MPMFGSKAKGANGESYSPMGALKVEKSVMPATDPVMADRMLGIEVPQSAKDRPLAQEKA